MYRSFFQDVSIDLLYQSNLFVVFRVCADVLCRLFSSRSYSCLGHDVASAVLYAGCQRFQKTRRWDVFC